MHPDTQEFFWHFDDHVAENSYIRRLSTQRISSTGLENMWYKGWIESVDPRSESFNYMHGAYVYSYGTTEDYATITFSRTIPESEITTSNIRIYNKNGFDLTEYFTYKYYPDFNRLSIIPFDDVIFKYDDQKDPFFYVHLRATIKDIEGQSLGTALNHGFYLKTQYIQSPDTVDTHSVLQSNENTLCHIESLGTAVWNEEKRLLTVTSEQCNYFMKSIKQIDTNSYTSIISSIKLPDRTLLEEQGYAILQPSTPGEIGRLATPLAEGIQPKQYIHLKNLRTGKRYTPIIEEDIIKAPADLPSGAYALMLMEGLRLTSGNTLDENIYFVIYLDNTTH